MSTAAVARPQPREDERRLWKLRRSRSLALVKGYPSDCRGGRGGVRRIVLQVAPGRSTRDQMPRAVGARVCLYDVLS